MFFKWVFKTFVAVMILTNTFNIVLAVFDVSQYVIQQSAGIIQNGTEIQISHDTIDEQTFQPFNDCVDDKVHTSAPFLEKGTTGDT